MTKLYILLLDDVPLGYAINAAAHAGCSAALGWRDDPDFETWAATSYRKVTCTVTQNQLAQCKLACGGGWIDITESALGSKVVAVVFKPRDEWPKVFKHLRLYGSTAKPQLGMPVTAVFKELSRLAQAEPQCSNQVTRMQGVLGHMEEMPDEVTADRLRWFKPGTVTPAVEFEVAQDGTSHIVEPIADARRSWSPSLGHEAMAKIVIQAVKAWRRGSTTKAAMRRRG